MQVGNPADRNIIFTKIQLRGMACVLGDIDTVSIAYLDNKFRITFYTLHEIWGRGRGRMYNVYPN